jgi:tRNA threonylcarbamoyladenosine biosynthesis protein TsaB
MLILTIRTDNPEAELGLFEDDKQLAYEKWHAYRELSNTILKKLDELMKSQNKKFADVQGIVCFKGPGSFTGLRIGLTVGNTLAYSLGLSIVTANGDNWQQSGIAALRQGGNEKVALPEYGAEAHITIQKK